MKMLGFLSVAWLLFISSASFGHGKNTPHCEKNGGDGKPSDIEAKDQADCESKGGKWTAKEKDKHDHKEADSHEGQEHKH